MSDAEKEPVAELNLQQQSVPDSEPKDAKIFKEHSNGSIEPSGGLMVHSDGLTQHSDVNSDITGHSKGLTEPSDITSVNKEKCNEIASPEKSNEIASPDKSNEIPSPEKSNEISSPEKSNEIASPEKTNEIVNPEKSNEIASPEKNNEIASPEKSNEIASPEKSNEIASPEKVPQVKEFENELDFEDEAESIVDGKSKGASENEVKEKSSEDTHTEEDGLCTPEKNTKNKEEETKDDGECSDGGDEDLEEGELNEDVERVREDSGNSKPNVATKQMCRFYSRGQCFFGSNCRFAHVNTISGNYYNMFGPSTPVPRVPYSDYFDSTAHGMMSHRSGPPQRSTGSDFLPPPQVCSQPAAAEESAWERGLLTAKELVRKANKRKIEDADFSEKSLNLSLIVNEKNVPEFLESDTSYKKKRRDVEFPKYDESHEAYEDYEARTHYRQGFDNFDVRYHREQPPRGADRGRRDRMDREPRDKFRPKSPRSKERYRDDRLQEVQPRSREYSRDANDYFDPWRRSKSPKGNARRSRSRSGSYSSVSSYSWSDRSFSSNSYSRSSRSSSRSPPPHQKRKPSPTITNPPFISDKPGPPPTNTFTTMKKKPEGRGGVSSSRSRTPSISRSRSFSRSISMSSVSSASSRDSLSNSSGSISRRQNSTSILKKQEENPPLPVGKPVDPPKVPAPPPPPPVAVPLPSMYLNYPIREKEVIQEIIESPIVEELERDPLEERFLAPEIEPLPFPSLQHLLPTNDKAKEPLKVAPHKQQIKLTLLNKNPQNKMNILPKKELDINRKPIDEASKSAGFYFGIKGPLSPPAPPVVVKPTPVLVPKKSASSRRDELLKQLKAVEDAIARKRAKFG